MLKTRLAAQQVLLDQTTNGRVSDLTHFPTRHIESECSHARHFLPQRQIRVRGCARRQAVAFEGIGMQGCVSLVGNCACERVKSFTSWPWWALDREG